MQGQHNPFAQFQTAPMMGGQFQGANQMNRISEQGKPQMNAQFPQFPNQQFPNPQMMQFQTMQQQPMNMNMMQNQPGLNPGMNPGINTQQQNMLPPPKTRLIVKLENNERGFYSTMLAQVDPTDQGRVDGKVAGPFFKRSGLPQETLKTIWRMTSSDKKNLDKEEFYVALRLVAYAQNNLPVTEDSIRQNLKVPLPKFNAEVAPPPQKKEPEPQPTANLLDMGGPSTGLQTNVQPMGQMNQPQQFNQPMNQPMNQQFNQTSFDAFGGMNNPTTPSMGVQNTAALTDLMDQTPPVVQSNRPSTQVAPSTNLMGDDDLLGGGGAGPVNSVSSFDQPVKSTQPPQMNIAQANLMEDSLVPTNPVEQSPMGNIGTASPSTKSTTAIDDSQEYSDVLVDLTPEYVKQYQTIYDQFDPTQKGILTQAEIGDVFFRSGLSNEILFQIWSFCDTGDKGCLDKPEFMLALHLIAMSKKKIRLPTVLPPKYEKFLKDMKKKLPAKHFLIEKNAANQHTEESYGGVTHQEETYQAQTHSYEETHHHHGGHSEHSNNYGHQEVNTYEAREDVPLTGGGYRNSSVGGAGETTQLLMKMQEHQNELMSTASHIKDSNNRLLADKREDINRLTAILESCQDILQKLISENDYVQSELNLSNNK